MCFMTLFLEYERHSYKQQYLSSDHTLFHKPVKTLKAYFTVLSFPEHNTKHIAQLCYQHLRPNLKTTHFTASD